MILLSESGSSFILTRRTEPKSFISVEPLSTASPAHSSTTSQSSSPTPHWLNQTSYHSRLNVSPSIHLIHPSSIHAPTHTLFCFLFSQCTMHNSLFFVMDLSFPLSSFHSPFLSCFSFSFIYPSTLLLHSFACSLHPLSTSFSIPHLLPHLHPYLHLPPHLSSQPLGEKVWGRTADVGGFFAPGAPLTLHVDECVRERTLGLKLFACLIIFCLILSFV